MFNLKTVGVLVAVSLTAALWTANSTINANLSTPTPYQAPTPTMTFQLDPAPSHITAYQGDNTDSRYLQPTKHTNLYQRADYEVQP